MPNFLQAERHFDDYVEVVKEQCTLSLYNGQIVENQLVDVS
jgi:hypothetical protein